MPLCKHVKRCWISREIVWVYYCHRRWKFPRPHPIQQQHQLCERRFIRAANRAVHSMRSQPMLSAMSFGDRSAAPCSHKPIGIRSRRKGRCAFHRRNSIKSCHPSNRRRVTYQTRWTNWRNRRIGRTDVVASNPGHSTAVGNSLATMISTTIMTQTARGNPANKRWSGNRRRFCVKRTHRELKPIYPPQSIRSLRNACPNWKLPNSCRRRRSQWRMLRQRNRDVIHSARTIDRIMKTAIRADIRDTLRRWYAMPVVLNRTMEPFSRNRGTVRSGTHFYQTMVSIQFTSDLSIFIFHFFISVLIERALGISMSINYHIPDSIDHC